MRERHVLGKLHLLLFLTLDGAKGVLIMDVALALLICLMEGAWTGPGEGTMSLTFPLESTHQSGN